MNTVDFNKSVYLGYITFASWMLVTYIVPKISDKVNQMYYDYLQIDLDNDDDLIYMVHKFTFWTLLLTRSLTLIWDKKDLKNFPIENFLELNLQGKSVTIKTQKDVEQFLERNKSKTRITLFKHQGIFIESTFQSALGYLKRLTNSINN